jgi:L-seryl-tRNA(Ser) seleniumtransferase
MRLPATAIRSRAETMQKQLSGAAHLKTTILSGESLVGGGSAPTSSLPTFLLAVTAESLSADELAARLRHNTPPIVTRVEEGRVLLDLRTVLSADEEAQIVRALLNMATRHPELR